MHIWIQFRGQHIWGADAAPNFDSYLNCFEKLAKNTLKAYSNGSRLPISH